MQFSNCTSFGNGEENFRVANNSSAWRHLITNCVSHQPGMSDNIDPSGVGVVSLNNSWDLNYTPLDVHFLALPPQTLPVPDPRLSGGAINPWNMNPAWNSGNFTPPLFYPNPSSPMLDTGLTTGPLRGQFAIGCNNSVKPITGEFNRFRAVDLGAKEAVTVLPGGVEIFAVQSAAIVADDLTVHPALLVLASGATELNIGTPKTINDVWQSGSNLLVDPISMPMVDSQPSGNTFLVNTTEHVGRSASRIFLQANDGTAFSNVIPISLNLD